MGARSEERKDSGGCKGCKICGGPLSPREVWANESTSPFWISHEYCGQCTDWVFHYLSRDLPKEACDRLSSFLRSNSHIVVEIYDTYRGMSVMEEFEKDSSIDNIFKELGMTNQTEAKETEKEWIEKLIKAIEE